MVELAGGAMVEFGQIVVESWEHKWKNPDNQGDVPLAQAERVLPREATEKIYQFLEKTEKMLLRGSLPFPPFDFRVRLVDHQPGFSHNFDDY